MAEQQGRRDTSVPNDPSRQEKADGPRENVNIEDLGGSSQDRSGSTNRPIEEEQRERQDLPPRGENKEGGHA
jgi:hypothetical protein